MSEGLVLSERFRLISQLGAGGMGSVWIAQDLNLNTEVAIKLIDPSLLESAEAVSRFRQEAQAAAMIRSTHVVQILDHGIDQGRPYMAMELLTGENLGQRLERLGRLPPGETAQILSHVARAVALAHARGIVHRDLKPDNIFLIQEGDEEIAKVLDFGIARRTGGLSDSALSKTRTGTMLGTPYYMSPEQATGQAVDHLADIWSFGVIAFECLTGKRAFDGESIGALFHSICMLPIPIPSAVATVPQGFDGWFDRAVARDRQRRFNSVKEAAEALRSLCGITSSGNANLERSGARIAMGSYENLSTTAVSAVTTGFDQTASPSSNTLAGRVRRRPVLAFAAAVLGFGILAAAVTLSRGRAAPVPMNSITPTPAAVLPSAALESPTAAAPVVELAPASPIASVDPPKGSTGLEHSPSLASNVQHGSTSKPGAGSVARAAAASAAGGQTQSQHSTKKSFIKRDDNAAGI